MSKKTNALKKLAVALGYGSAVSDYSGNTTAEVLREIAVKMGCASSTYDIRTNDVVKILEYIADNYGDEEKEPYDLTITKTHATVTVKRNGKNISAGADRLHNGDKLEITATADEGYALTTLTANGDTIESGDEVTVDNAAITIVATGTEVTPEDPGEE